MKTANEFIKENGIEYFVTATDRFMSGWWNSNNKISKMVVCCKSLEQAREIAMNFESRSELNRIDICGKKPYYSPNRYDVNYYDFDLKLIKSL